MQPVCKKRALIDTVTQISLASERAPVVLVGSTNASWLVLLDSKRSRQTRSEQWSVCSSCVHIAFEIAFEVAFEVASDTNVAALEATGAEAAVVKQL